MYAVSETRLRIYSLFASRSQGHFSFLSFQLPIGQTMRFNQSENVFISNPQFSWRKTTMNVPEKGLVNTDPGLEFNKHSSISSYPITRRQNFRLVQIETYCRRNFKVHLKKKKKNSAI